MKADRGNPPGAPSLPSKLPLSFPIGDPVRCASRLSRVRRRPPRIHRLPSSQPDPLSFLFRVALRDALGSPGVECTGWVLAALYG